MIEWSKSGKCLACGSPDHKVAACPNKRKFSGSNRPPTPRGSSSSKDKRQFASKSKVAFKVSQLDTNPPASGREGDEEEEALAIAEVDTYLAARSLGFHHNYDQPWPESEDSDFE